MIKFMLILCILIPHVSLAGPRVGNGGGAWVCQEAAGNFRWVTLVDLFEGRSEYGLEALPAVNGDPWQILQAQFDLVKASMPGLAARLTITPSQLRQVVQMVPEFTQLTRIDDDQVRVTPSPATCQNGTLYYGQLANFTFDGRLLIASDLWSAPQFSDQGRAALLMHEIVYKALRDQVGETNSSRSRAIVALLFSTLSPEEIDSRVAVILSQPQPGMPPVLMAPFNLICTGGIESESSTTIPGPYVRLTSTSAGTLSASLDRFTYTVRLAPDGASPAELAIIDSKTGIRTTLEQAAMTDDFRKNAHVSLSLELTAEQELVLLQCRAVPKR